MRVNEYSLHLYITVLLVLRIGRGVKFIRFLGGFIMGDGNASAYATRKEESRGKAYLW